MKPKNRVFIATSIDGFIADKDGKIDWLHDISSAEGEDMGYVQFMTASDALVMGRNTFETVLGFDIPWPYEKPVFVLSNNLKTIPEHLQGKVKIVSGSLEEVLADIHQQGYRQLYIDGGKCIQSFLAADLIDEMVLTTIPVLLGSGLPLFGELEQQLKFDCCESKVYFDSVVQSHFVRKREI